VKELSQLPTGARVLIVRLRSLGDTMLMTPALRLLHDWRPDLRVSVLVEHPWNELLEGNPAIHSVMLLRGKVRTAWRVRRARFGAVVNLHGGPTSAFITRLSGAGWRAGCAHFRLLMGLGLLFKFKGQGMLSRWGMLLAMSGGAGAVAGMFQGELFGFHIEKFAVFGYLLERPAPNPALGRVGMGKVLEMAMVRSLRARPRHLRAWLYVLWMALFFFEAAWAQKTDIVALKNWDRITGEVKELKFGKLEYSTDDVGTIFIEWDKVIFLKSKSTFELETEEGDKYFGTVDTDTTENKILVLNQNRTVGNRTA